MQSQVLGGPLFSTLQTTSEKTVLYNTLKQKLDVTSLEELEQVPWKDLMKAYQVSDPRNGLPEVSMIDGVLIDEGWRENYSLKGALRLGIPRQREL